MFQSAISNSIIVDSMQQKKFEVHTPFRFEAVDPGTKTVQEWATYARFVKTSSKLHYIMIRICHFVPRQYSNIPDTLTPHLLSCTGCLPV